MGITQLTLIQLRPGDEVVVPAFGGEDFARVVRARGGRPVVADIDPRTYCLDTGAAQAAMSRGTVGIAPVHLFGHPADLVGLLAVADRHGVSVFAHGEQPEDCATLEAARRRHHAAYLDARLRGVGVPAVRVGAHHAYTEYVVRVPGNGRPDRDAFARSLRARGVACRVPVPTPVHRLPAFRADVRAPVAERAADECLALPLRADMTRRELQRMVSACNALGGLLLEAAA